MKSLIRTFRKHLSAMFLISCVTCLMATGCSQSNESKNNTGKENMSKENMSKEEHQTLRILFIGNSHTFFNDMPAMVADKFREDGTNCEVTMIAHGAWYLEQHAKEPETRFNILYGNYDYIVLQEFSHPFGPEEKYFEAVRTINEWITESGARPVIYGTWSMKEEPEKQEELNQAHRKIAEEIGALLAPVGENWWDYIEENPDVEMYYKDGAHASAEGSAFAAEYIFQTIKEDLD